MAIDSEPTVINKIRIDLMSAQAVEYVRVKVGARLIVYLVVADCEVRERLIEGRECVECGHTVTDEGHRPESMAHHFCCPSCEERVAKLFEQLHEWSRAGYHY